MSKLAIRDPLGFLLVGIQSLVCKYVSKDAHNCFRKRGDTKVRRRARESQTDIATRREGRQGGDHAAGPVQHVRGRGCLTRVVGIDDLVGTGARASVR